MSDERGWLARTIVNAFGEERLDGWFPEPPPRCPWTARAQQCTWFAGHRGTCRTEEVITNTQTGKTFKRRREYLGINYDVP